MSATTASAMPPRSPSHHAVELGADQPCCDTQQTHAGADHLPRVTQSTPVGADGSVSWLLLKLAAEAVDDIEKVRIAAGNRLDAMTRPTSDHGHGLAADRREVLHATELHDTLAEVEKLAIKQLQRAMRAHPFGPWCKRQVGVGEKQLGRLLAAVGDPYWNGAAQRPRRGPAELWAYCGLHTVPGHNPTDAHSPVAGDCDDFVPEGGQTGAAAQQCRAPLGNVAPRRRKGQRANWNADAKMRAYLVAESCMKQRHSPYREVYDFERAKWSARDVSDGHAHNHALRVVAKEILKDLWREGRRLALDNTDNG